MSIVSIDKVIHFGLFTKWIPKRQREKTTKHHLCELSFWFKFLRIFTGTVCFSETSVHWWKNEKFGSTEIMIIAKKITLHITSKNLSAYNFAIFLPKICHKLNKQNFGMRVLPNTVGNYSWKQSSLLTHYSCCCAPSKARYFTHCSCKVGPRQVLRLPFLKHTTVYNPDNDLIWEYETIWKRSASSDMRTFSLDVRVKTLWCEVTLILLNTLKLLMSFSLQKTQISRDFCN